jgi:predicted ATPase
VGLEEPRPTIAVSFQIHGDAREYLYRLQFAFQGNQDFGQPGDLHPSDELLELDGKPLLHRQRGEKGKWSWVHEPPSTAKIKPDTLNAISRFPAVPDIANAYTALVSGIGYYSLSSTVLSIFDVPLRHGKQLMEQVPGLRDDAQNFLAMLKSITQDLHRPEIRKAILASLQQVNPSVVSVDLDSLTHPDHTVVGHEVDGQIMQLRLAQESDGFRRFFAHLLALYQTPAKLLNIFEEPENAIFPGALSLLADEFKAAAAHGRGQVLLTTHSPGLLDHFDVDSIRVVELDDAATVIGRVSSEQREAAREALLTTGELLTVDPARLDKSTASGGVRPG